MFDFIRDDRFTVIERGFWLLFYPVYALLAALGLPLAVSCILLGDWRQTLQDLGDWRQTLQDLGDEVRYQFVTRYKYLVLEASVRGVF